MEVEEVEEGCCEPACGLWVKPVKDDKEEMREGRGIKAVSIPITAS